MIDVQAALTADSDGMRGRYRAMQRALVGPDPLAEGGRDWPDLAAPVRVSPLAPLYGWRYWTLTPVGDTLRLTAPFLSRVYEAPVETPGVLWHRATNTNSTAGCPTAGQGAHPRQNCRCGIRVMQSFTALRAFAENQANRVGPMQAAGEVAFFGRVVGYAPDDDWQWTARAQFVRLERLHLFGVERDAAEQLVEHYEVPAHLL